MAAKHPHRGSFFLLSLPLLHHHFFFLFVFCFFRASRGAYGGSQAKSQIGATVARLHHNQI